MTIRALSARALGPRKVCSLLSPVGYFRACSSLIVFLFFMTEMMGEDLRSNIGGRAANVQLHDRLSISSPFIHEKLGAYFLFIFQPPTQTLRCVARFSFAS